MHFLVFFLATFLTLSPVQRLSTFFLPHSFVLDIMTVTLLYLVLICAIAFAEIDLLQNTKAVLNVIFSVLLGSQTNEHNYGFDVYLLFDASK